MSFRDYVDWLWQAQGRPYIPWWEGEVSRGDGPPAWAVNEPLPDISEINGAFCVAVYNLADRWFGVKIPNPYGDEAWDGGVAATWEYWYSSSMWYTDRAAQGFVDGDLLVSPYAGPSAQGHVSMVCHYDGVPYVIEWITNGGLVWNYTVEESDAWGRYQICIPASQWSEGKANGGAPPANKPLSKFPGNCATPKETAYWMAYVAETEFGLPKVLPVMTSCVELTSAWTSSGCLDDIPGFLPGTAQDFDSLGLFQQRPSQGWGTPEECSDPEHSLRKFCQEAAKLKNYERNKETTDPEVLGAWCQAVQRSAFPERYADIGYPLATQLLQGYDGGEEPVPPGKPSEAGKIEDAWVGFTVDPEQWLRTGSPVPEGTWARFVKLSNGNYGLEFVVPKGAESGDPTSDGFKGDVIEFAGEGEVLKLRGKMEITAKEGK